MRKVAVIIPFKLADDFRYSNLEFIIDYYSNLKFLDFYIMQQLDVGDRIVEISGVKTLTLKKEGMFHKSLLNNTAFKSLRDKYDTFIYLDTDIVVPLDGLEDLIKSYVDGEYGGTSVLSPYEDRLMYTTEEQRSKFIENPSFDFDGEFIDINQPFGGMFIVSKDTYTALKGFDENIIGWGCEDDAVRMIADEIGVDIFYGGLIAYHLWHPPSKDSLDEAQIAKNRYYLGKYYSDTNRLGMFGLRKF